MSSDQTPPLSAAEKRAEVVARLPRFLDRGFVVSIQDGSFQHQGDSLLFSGLALYALTCDEGKPIADAFEKMLLEMDGNVYRHPDQKDREPSLDGLLGMYRGLIKRINCGEKDRWAAVLKHHRARVAASLPAEFNLISDTLAFKLGMADEPDHRRLHNLAVEVDSWAKLVVSGKKACYRIHLGLLALQDMQDLGYPVTDLDRGAFSSTTKDLHMATVDQYSGRVGLSEFLSGFAYNRMQYAHQRGPWESEDMNGSESPAIDFLVGYADLYGAPK